MVLPPATGLSSVPSEGRVVSDRITTGAIKDALLRTYTSPEYATFFEVGDGTGSHHSRWADAVSMACWPSRGLKIIGFEIKASRSDWLREKKNPKKSIAVQQFCDQWILVTAPGVLGIGELPANWGHMELSGRKLVTVTKAPDLAHATLSREFMASLLRRASQASKELIDARIEAELRETRAAMEERIAEAVDVRSNQNAAAISACEKFKEVTGIDIMGRWNSAAHAEQLGKDFLDFVAARDRLTYHGLEHAEKQLREAADSIRTAVAAMGTSGLERARG